MPLFPSSLAQGIFDAVYLVWVVVFFLERVIVSRSGQGTAKTRSDRGSAFLIWASVFVSISVAYAFAYEGLGILPDWVFYVGISLMVLGIFVREWAVVTLGGYFSYRVRVREDHRVVDNGPYGVIRHPAYTGSILTVVGLGLALRTSAGAVALVLFCALAYGYRIHVEENALLKELGNEYSKYMQRTKRLIPWVI